MYFLNGIKLKLLFSFSISKDLNRITKFKKNVLVQIFPFSQFQINIFAIFFHFYKLVLHRKQKPAAIPSKRVR